jgi:hypothetical protein
MIINLQAELIRYQLRKMRYTNFVGGQEIDIILEDV